MGIAADSPHLEKSHAGHISPKGQKLLAAQHAGARRLACGYRLAYAL